MKRGRNVFCFIGEDCYVAGYLHLLMGLKEGRKGGEIRQGEDLGLSNPL